MARAIWRWRRTSRSLASSSGPRIFRAGTGIPCGLGYERLDDHELAVAPAVDDVDVAAGLDQEDVENVAVGVQRLLRLADRLRSQGHAHPLGLVLVLVG